MKKPLQNAVALLTCLAILCTCVSFAYAEEPLVSDPVFSVSSPSVPVTENTVLVNVTVSENVGFCAGELFLNYDPAVLIPTQVISDLQGVENFYFASNKDFAPGTVKFVFLSTSLVTAAANVFSVRFTVKPGAFGNTAVSLGVPKLLNKTILEQGFARVANEVTNGVVSIAEKLALVSDSPLSLATSNGLVKNLMLSANTVAQVKEQFTNSTVRFRAKNNRVLLDSDSLTTGCKIQLLDGENVVQESVFVASGDVDGNYSIDGTDAFFVSMILSNLLTEESIGSAAYLAADVNYDGTVNEADYNYLLSAGIKANDGQITPPPPPSSENDFTDLAADVAEIPVEAPAVVTETAAELADGYLVSVETAVSPLKALFANLNLEAMFSTIENVFIKIFSFIKASFTA